MCVSQSWAGNQPKASGPCACSAEKEEKTEMREDGEEGEDEIRRKRRMKERSKRGALNVPV